MDGKVIEAIVHEKYENVYGVQFHPEIWELYPTKDNYHKSSRADSVENSYHELLKNENSIRFHEEYWKYFSTLF